VPCGVVPKTGIAGLTLGGGVGWLIRKYGMSIDNLLSCQIVTADGNVLTAHASENEDLFWALRGGGGNFGVVTLLTFRAQPVKTVVGGLILYPRQVAVDLIRNFRDHVEKAPDELTAYAALLHAPDGTPVTGIVACYCGDEREADRVLRPFRTFGNPIMDATQVMPFPAMQSLLAAAFPDGNHNYWKSSLQATLPDEAIDLVVEFGNRTASPLSALVVEYYGGAAGRIAPDATAFPHRNLPWDIIMAAQWTDPEESACHRAWAREAEDAFRPFSGGAHLLAALDADDKVSTAFGSNLPRLMAIKAKYDPKNFFRVNQNIKPALTQSAPL
jgi:FAD/FMN-containing dehydrogenase